MVGHAPVLLAEAVAALAPRDGEAHCDATFGGGGYSRAILAAAECRVIAIDRDPDAIARGAGISDRLALRQGRFGDLDTLAGEALDGVVFDFGVSSFQLDQAERGFSFRFDAPLDMRMERAGPSAADAVNRLSEAALAEAIFRLGEESQSRRIAKAIVAARPIETTAQLADLVEAALGGRRGAKTHPATRTFQAVRMLVNDELGEIARGLAAAERALKPGGRLVAVTFHSLEDRLVKAFASERAGALGAGSRHAPERAAGPAPTFTLPTRKAAAPSDAEIASNPRARSAKLRLAVRAAAPARAFDPAPLAPLALSEWSRL